MNNSFDCTWHLLRSTCIDNDLMIENNEILINNSSINQCPCYNVSRKEIFIVNNNSFILGEKDQVIIQTIGLNHNIQRYFRCVLTFFNHSIMTRIGNLHNDLLICETFQVKELDF